LNAIISLQESHSSHFEKKIAGTSVLLVLAGSDLEYSTEVVDKMLTSIKVVRAVTVTVIANHFAALFDMRVKPSVQL